MPVRRSSRTRSGTASGPGTKWAPPTSTSEGLVGNEAGAWTCACRTRASDGSLMQVAWSRNRTARPP
eukprot:13491791-Heterocapsa_arctica.AAC.1